MRQPASRSRPAIQEIPEGRETFFRLSPAVDGKPQCFAVKRGETRERLDAHFHKPEFRLSLSKLLAKYPEAQRLDECADVFCGPFGTEIAGEDYQDAGVPLLRISNITDEGAIDESELVFLTPEKAEALKSTQVEPRDLIISQRGTLGMPAVVPGTYPKWNISANLIAIRRVEETSPEFVQLFLSSDSGATQLQRRQSGQVQGKLTTEDVASILIPNPANETELIELMRTARTTRQQKIAKANELLAGFDGYLLSQLGLTAPAPDARKVFATQLGQLRATGRVNADYFHPERILAIRAMEKNRKTMRVERLRDVADFVRDGVPAETSENYLGLANVQSHTGELVESSEEDAEGLCFRFAPQDVLFARLRPYLNKVHRAEKAGVCSTEFHVIRIHPAAKPQEEIRADYLATVLRSSLVLAQTRHMMTGNTHPRLANEDVANLVVPIPDPKIQEAIASEVMRRRVEARKLRAEAEVGWAAAKAKFERKLLGESAKP